MDDATLTKRLLAYLGMLPGWEWWERPDPYPSTVVGLFYGELKTAPDRAVAVRVYAPQDGVHVSRRRVQLRSRGAQRRLDGADQLADIAFVALDGLSRYRGILRAERISFAPLGADQSGRQERTDNYLITLDNLEAS